MGHPPRPKPPAPPSATWTVRPDTGIDATIVRMGEPTLRLAEHQRHASVVRPARIEWSLWSRLRVTATPEQSVIAPNTGLMPGKWTWHVQGWPADIDRASRLTPSVVATVLAVVVALEQPPVRWHGYFESTSSREGSMTWSWCWR